MRGTSKGHRAEHQYVWCLPFKNCLQNLNQVVPAVVQLLQQLPRAWLTEQTGPKQVQADFTQVMSDLRK